MKRLMGILAVCLMLPQGITMADSKNVYTSPTGYKYHYIAKCASKCPKKITLDEAKRLRYKPCKKCVLKCVKKRSKKQVKQLYKH